MQDKNEMLKDNEIDIRELENEAIIKYEKETKPYRKKYESNAIQIKCQKCGSTHNLMKHVDDKTKTEFWFCKNCVMERAREIARKERRK